MTTTPIAMPAPKVAERPARDVSGWAMLGLGIGLIVVAVALFVWNGGRDEVQAWPIVLGVVLVVAALTVLAGLTPVNPGEARVVQLLGRYQGTVRTDGLRWLNPLTARWAISTRIRNHETGVAKVNDAGGSPIEI